MPRTLRRSAPAALALLLACAKGADLPAGPTTVLHYPAFIDAYDGQLLIVNLDQDLAYDGGAVVALAGDLTSDPPPRDGTAISGGVPLPNMAGQLLVIHGPADPALTGAGKDCRTKTDGTPGLYYAADEADPTRNYVPPFALVAGRFEESLFKVALDSSVSGPFGRTRDIGLNPFSATSPFGVGFSCSPDGTPRAWVGYQSGLDEIGYVAQIDLTRPAGSSGSIVQVNVGGGGVRSFAYDDEHDRLYFTGRERFLSAPVRWLDVGSGCKTFDDGVQDERLGGCHVDGGFDLSLRLRGAEPNEIALSTRKSKCTAPGFDGQQCRRAYLSVRMYDADLAAVVGRPSSDVGGKLVVLELPEGGLGRPEPQLVGEFDIGVVAGPLKVIPRSGGIRDLVAVAAVDDAMLWLYDDELGAMVKVLGRDASGVPLLGHRPSGIAYMNRGDGTARLFVTSYTDHWVSAVDLTLASPSDAHVIMDPNHSTRHWHPGVTP